MEEKKNIPAEGEPVTPEAPVAEPPVTDAPAPDLNTGPAAPQEQDGTGDADNRLWDNLSQSAGFGEAPQQAFLRPPPGAKIASVNTLALLAVSCKPENGAK